MKRCVLSIAITVILCLLASISVAAIDTPWLPLEPDQKETEETESSSEVTEAFTTEGLQESVSPVQTDPVLKDSETDPVSEDSETEAISTEPPAPKKGCGASYTHSLALLTSVLAAALLLRQPRRTERLERSTYEH